MQCFVTGLVQGSNSPIVAMYEESTQVPADAHTAPVGGQVPVLLRGIDHQYIQAAFPYSWLLDTWRNDYGTVVDAEAQRRIELVYPAAMQSASALLRQNDIMSYGTDVANWPSDQQAKNTEMLRGTSYITSVNAAAATIKASAPNNPCDDTLWPASIPPISL
jgi:hypothetical protein